MINNHKNTLKQKQSIVKLWLGRRGIVQTILEDYRGQDIEAETQEIQQFLNGDDEEGLSC